MMKMLNSESDKRRHRRVPVGLTMAIRTSGSDRPLRGRITDLSQGGMTFETNADLEEGTVLFLKTDHPLEVRGEVRHVTESAGRRRYGVRFHRFTATQMKGRRGKT